MVKAVAALINFCYLVRRNVIDETTLVQIQDALDRFHQYREIFREVGIRPDGFSLPRQHSHTLHLLHHAIWCPKWALLFDYRVKAHQGRQTTLSPFGEEQAAGANAHHKPVHRQACCSSRPLHFAKYAQRQPPLHG